MKIDLLHYNEKCSCGKEHKMQTKLCIISGGCLKELNKYLIEYGLLGYTVAIYDQNTYLATQDRHPDVQEEIVLDPANLHANEHGVDYLLKSIPKNAKVLIAIGAGTVHDLTRYSAYTLGIDFVSCPTAASVDGFCSSVAAMTWHGCKKTLTAKAPSIVLADTDIIKKAPIYLARSGFGDMIGKYVALFDWRIGNILGSEYYCEKIADMTLSATKEVLESVSGIIEGCPLAYEKLMYGLLLSGLAMQMTGNSRPASGAEHHISHLIEMAPHGLGLSSDALHGEKVGVGTLLAIEEYQRLGDAIDISFSDYAGVERQEIIDIFGREMAEEIFSENLNDCASGITKKTLILHFESIRREIKKLPRLKELKRIYQKFNVKSSLSDIGVNEGMKNELLKYSPLVRNRLTLMRLRSAIESGN